MTNKLIILLFITLLLVAPAQAGYIEDLDHALTGAAGAIIQGAKSLSLADNTYTLTMNVQGNGEAIITTASATGGSYFILSGQSRTMSFPVGEQITMTFYPFSGSTFIKACDTTIGDCQYVKQATYTILTPETTTINAEFSAAPTPTAAPTTAPAGNYILTMNVQGNGEAIITTASAAGGSYFVLSGQSRTMSFPVGEQITMTFYPFSGSTFIKACAENGECQIAKQASYTILAPETHTITAEFSASPSPAQGTGITPCTFLDANCLNPNIPGDVERMTGIDMTWIFWGALGAIALFIAYRQGFLAYLSKHPSAVVLVIFLGIVVYILYQGLLVLYGIKTATETAISNPILPWNWLK